MFDTQRRAAITIQDSPSGNLGPLTFPSLIHDVCEDKNTGVLTIKDEQHQKSIYIDKGKIVFAASNDTDDRLGALLIRRGMVSLAKLSAAAAESSMSGERMGKVLVEKQVIRPQDLVWGVCEQVKEIVISLFDWTRGTYQLNVGPLPTREVITLKMSTGDIVLEGVKRLDSWTRIQLAVGDQQTRYIVSSRLEEIGRGMNLSLEEWTLLSRCEGPVTLSHLCEATPMKDFDVCRLVWALTVVGMIQRLD